MESMSSSSAKSTTDIAQWQSRIQEVQKNVLTPEVVSRIQSSAQRNQRCLKSAKTAKRLEKANYLSATTNMMTLQTYSASSAPQAYRESSDRTRTWASKIQASTRSRPMTNEEEDACERELESVTLELQAEVVRGQQNNEAMPSAMASVMAFDRMDYQQRAQTNATVSSELSALLEQLALEPNNDPELQAKIALFETFYATMETVRSL
jgi:hypothetical protein